MLSSLVHVLLIGVDRAFATMTQLTYKQKMNMKTALVLLAVTWTSLILIIFTGAGYRYATISQSDRNVVISIPTTIFPHAFVVYVSSPLIYVILLGNGLLYSCVLVAFARAANKVHVAPSNKLSRSDANSRRITKMSVAIVGVMLACWTPVAVLAIILPPNPVERPTLFRAYIMAYDIVLVIIMIPLYLNNFCILGIRKHSKKLTNR